MYNGENVGDGFQEMIIRNYSKATKYRLHAKFCAVFDIELSSTERKEWLNAFDPNVRAWKHNYCNDYDDD